MPIDMTKLNEIAQEWDPTPFLKAIEQAAMQPAPMAQAGGDFASMMGQSPAGMQPGAMPMPQQPPQPPTVGPVGATPPPQQAAITPPRTQAQVDRIPSLKDILGGY